MTPRSLTIAFSAVCLIAGGSYLASQAQAAPQKSPTLKLTSASKGKEYSVKKGDTFTVTLPSNPSTGYQLCMISTGAEPWTVVGRTFKSEAKGSEVGAGGQETITFKTTKAGSGQVIFVNIRTFDLSTLKEADPWSVSLKVK